MSTAAMRERREGNGWPVLVGAVVFSLAVHAVTVITMPDKAPPVAMKRTVEMELYVPPPPPPPPEEKPPEPPKPLEPPKPKPIVKADTPKPPPDAPPPPNDTPPPEPTKPVPIVVGISMGSTTTSGGFAVQVGNTTYGKADSKIVDPSEVKPYAAAKYAPPGSADSEPVPLGEVKPPYPEEARKNDVEGSVKLKVTTDETGQVTEVAIINGPGYGLNEAARDAIRRVKFKPAMKGGEAVGYTFVFTYTFLLD